MTGATITSKGQTTIPKSVRDRLNLKAGDRIEVVVQEKGTATMIPATLTLGQLRALIPHRPRTLTLEETDKTIRRHAAARAKG